VAVDHAVATGGIPTHGNQRSEWAADAEAAVVATVLGALSA